MTSDSPHPPRATPSPESTADAAVKTYNYLRLGLIALVALLAVSVGYEILDGKHLGSISAYYYTPARSVFVGVLVGIGIALVAIKGRDTGYEDVLLNAAGMLAPIVAFVPTPVGEGTIVNGDPVSCPAGAASCVPVDFEPGIDNAAWSLGLVGLLVLAVAVGLAVKDQRLGWAPPDQRRTTVGLCFAAVVYVAFLALDVFWHDNYVEWAHYLAAVPMFIALTGAAVSNAVQSDAHVQLRVMNGVPFTRFYWAVAAVMSTVLLAAGVYFVVTLGNPEGRWEYWVFVVEVLLLIPFTIFWILQTREWWDRGAPGMTEGADSQPTSAETSDSS